MAEPTLESLRARIESFLSADAAREITEDGELLFDLRGTEFRLEENRGRLLLHLWSPERNWVRRVLGAAEETPGRLVVEVERFGSRRTGKLVVTAPRRRAPSERERAAGRRQFAAWFRRLLERQFPRARLEALSTAADLKRSFSGLYTRALLAEPFGSAQGLRPGGREWWAVMGASGGEDSAAVDGLLTFALIWLDWNRRRHTERAWAGLRLFLPASRAATTANRLAILGATLKAELYEVDEDESTCVRIDPRDFGNLDTYLDPARRADSLLAAVGETFARIRALTPEAIEAVVPAARDWVSVRFRGVEFARLKAGEASFGLGHAQRPLAERNFRALAVLLKRLERERSASAPAKGALQRAQPERWLESLVAAAPQRIDPRLAPERLLRQVPAVSAGERGVADLLGATRDGQLIILELKASANLQLPLQGFDYWLRVRWHQQRSGFARGGYFPGLALRPDPPELLLVAPALQFHPTTETVAGYLAAVVPVTLVGINEDWRRGLRVVSRRRVEGR
ncbi:MAG: hypothetical protein L0212_12720 [Acidobacteria bacterium]|nr:hypothetical protein [Acidobacteriota bacterium]